MKIQQPEDRTWVTAAHWFLVGPGDGENRDRLGAQAGVHADPPAARARIGAFVNLPLSSLDRLSLQAHVDELAKA